MDCPYKRGFECDKNQCAIYTKQSGFVNICYEVAKRTGLVHELQIIQRNERRPVRAVSFELR